VRRLARPSGLLGGLDSQGSFDDADAAHARALAAGAVTLEELLDTPYGDRRAMVRDPFGNIWQIAHLIAGR
jgi:uncharacterized glyoxalase superfamily protein PhnB